MPEKTAFNINSNGIQQSNDSGISKNDKSSYSAIFGKGEEAKMNMAFVLLKYMILGGISIAFLWIISATVILIVTGRSLSVPLPIDINIIIPLVSSVITLILGYLFGKKE
jgi:hypothetical protein